MTSVASWLCLLSAVACVFLAVWVGPWGQWAWTSGLLILTAAGFGAWSDTLATNKKRRWLLSGEACGAKYILPSHVCFRQKGHDGPHQYTRIPE